MLRNLPNDYTRDMFLELLDAEGFAGRFDFVYLPVDLESHRRSGLGYAFVNFVSNEDAERVRMHFMGFNTWKLPSQKVCDTCWGAPLQGLVAHIDRYRNSTIMHADVDDAFKPVVFVQGIRVPFPPPTKRIRRPQPRNGR
jgi:hypothetical protein